MVFGPLRERVGGTTGDVRNDGRHLWRCGGSGLPCRQDRVDTDRRHGLAEFGACGGGYIDLAINLGVPADRIDTVVDYRGANEKGVKSLGTTDAGGSPALAELAALAATGDLHIPIAATYPLTAVRDAYQALADRKVHGRIVLHPQDLV